VSTNLSVLFAVLGVLGAFAVIVSSYGITAESLTSGGLKVGVPVLAGPAEALLARHLDQNVLGDEFSERSFVIEHVHHVELSDPGLITRHLDAILEEISDQAGHAHDP